MIIVADGGSTKCDWAFIEKSEKVIYQKTKGFNPNINNDSEIKLILESLSLNRNDVVEIYYFGSGCSSPEIKSSLKQVFDCVFKKSKNNIFHDLEGSALACCGKEKGIACILGTGSNICEWNGKEIVENDLYFGNGYILGDEGSGSHLGKLLIREAFTGGLGKELLERFTLEFGNRDQIIQKVYSRPGANVFLASCTHFISQNKENTVIKSIIYEAFEVFVQTNLFQISPLKNLPVNFVGSVAAIFKVELHEVLLKHNYVCNKVVQNPLEEIVKAILN